MEDRHATPLLALAGAAVATTLWLTLPAFVALSPPGSAGDRLALAAGALLPTAVVLFAMLTTHMVGRAMSGVLDPTAGRDTRFLVRNQRVITNTVEHFLVFAPAFIALAVQVPADWMKHVIALAWTFSLARLLFWAGYVRRPLFRSPGMAMTYGTNLVTTVAAALVWLR